MTNPSTLLLTMLLVIFLAAQTEKNLTAVGETQVQSLGRADPLEGAWLPTPEFLLGESPWTEEPGGLQSLGLHRVRHD